jgi:hypothetical protein
VGQVLTKSGAGDYATSWSTPGGSTTGPYFSATAPASATLSSSSGTKLVFPNVVYNVGNYYASGRFTPGVAGLYLVGASVRFISGAFTRTEYIRKNTTGYLDLSFPGDANGEHVATGSGVFEMNGSTDYLELWNSYSSSSGSKNMQSQSVFWAVYLRALP